MNSVDQRKKDVNLFYSTSILHKKIVEYFNNLEDGLEPNQSLAVISLQILQLEKNIKKLMISPYFAENSDLHDMYDDVLYLKYQKDRLTWYNDLQAVKPWILETYNNFVMSKGWSNNTITMKSVDGFITYILGFEHINMYKNIIKRLLSKQMTPNMLYRTVYGVITTYKSDLYESYNIHEGFNNPFNNNQSDLKTNTSTHKLSLNNYDMVPVYDKIKIKGVRPWKCNMRDKLYVKDHKVYSTRIFVPGDIVEECPVQLLSTDALYSRDIRDISFEIDPEKRLYGIPYGLANIYRNSDDTRTDGNIDYEYDPKEGLIRIYALRKIRKDEELVFRVSPTVQIYKDFSLNN